MVSKPLSSPKKIFLIHAHRKENRLLHFGGFVVFFDLIHQVSHFKNRHRRLGSLLTVYGKFQFSFTYYFTS